MHIQGLQITCQHFILNYRESIFWNEIASMIESLKNLHYTMVRVREYQKIFVKCRPYCQEAQQIGFWTLISFEIIYEIFCWQNTGGLALELGVLLCSVYRQGIDQPKSVHISVISWAQVIHVFELNRYCGLCLYSYCSLWSSLGPLQGGNHIVVWMWHLFLSNIAKSEASWKKRCNVDLMGLWFLWLL